MTKKPSVYIETSFVSYLTNRRSRDLIVAAHQEMSLRWWEQRRKDFELFISDLVISEIGSGNQEARKNRLDAVKGIELLTVTEPARKLTSKILERKIVPQKAAVDAAPMAIAAIEGIDYLLTWNCKHIANIEIARALRNVIESEGYEAPLICTPLEILGENDNE